MGNREKLVEMGAEEALVFDNPDFDTAIIGATLDGAAVYDYDRMLAQFSEDESVSTDEAAEFIDYNTLRAVPYMGEMAPVIVKTFGGEA